MTDVAGGVIDRRCGFTGGVIDGRCGFTGGVTGGRCGFTGGVTGGCCGFLSPEVSLLSDGRARRPLPTVRAAGSKGTTGQRQRTLSVIYMAAADAIHSIFILLRGGFQ